MSAPIVSIVSPFFVIRMRLSFSRAFRIFFIAQPPFDDGTFNPIFSGSIKLFRPSIEHNDINLA